MGYNMQAGLMGQELMFREEVGGRGCTAEGGTTAAGERPAGGGASRCPSAHSDQRYQATHTAPVRRVWGRRLCRTRASFPLAYYKPSFIPALLSLYEIIRVVKVTPSWARRSSTDAFTWSINEANAGSLHAAAMCSAQGRGDWKDAAQEAVRRESLQAYLAKRMTSVGPARGRQMVDDFGERIIRILNGGPAAAQKQLMTLKGVGKITAAKMKASWDKSKSKRAPLPTCDDHEISCWIRFFYVIPCCKGNDGVNCSRIVLIAGPGRADVAWVDPAAVSAVEAAATDPAPAAEALSWPWNADSRCYLAGMHHAEVTLPHAHFCLPGQLIQYECSCRL